MPSRPHSTAQCAGREAAARSAEKAQAGERRASDAKARARSLQQQLASARSGAQTMQASLQDELDALTVSFRVRMKVCTVSDVPRTLVSVMTEHLQCAKLSSHSKS